MNRGNGGGTKRGSDSARGSTAKKRRFVWPDELHASFVSAVFDVGLRTATPQAAARRPASRLRPRGGAPTARARAGPGARRRRGRGRGRRGARPLPRGAARRRGRRRRGGAG